MLNKETDMKQPRYMYLLVYQDDAYGPVYPTKKIFYSPAAAQAYAAEFNKMQDELMYFTREVEIQDECT